MPCFRDLESNKDGPVFHPPFKALSVTQAVEHQFPEIKRHVGTLILTGSTRHAASLDLIDVSLDKKSAVMKH